MVLPNADVAADAAGLFANKQLDEIVEPASKRRRARALLDQLPGLKPEILADHGLLRGWRQDIHAHPELGFEEHRTAALVAKLLRSWGIEVSHGEYCGKTGVVGRIEGAAPSAASVGLRADMDALPMQERGELPYRSANANAMHACGHDGHTAMLLGAAKYLAATRRFSGTVVFIFQPNEEGVVNDDMYPQGASGGALMVNQGLFTAFPCDEIYGIHNWPELPAGQVGVKAGPLMGSEDNFILTVRGKGGHGAMPHLCVDPLLAASHVVAALQSCVSRTAEPVDAVVV